MSTVDVGASKRDRRLAIALAAVERRFGPDVVARLRDRPACDPADRIVPSGSLGLDRATGLGGLPRGHLTELLGPESCGKTTLLYSALAATQRAGGLVALIDAEGSADGAALTACGADLDTLLIARPTSARDALLLAIILARCGGLDMLGFTSFATLRDLPGGLGHEPHPEEENLETARILTRGLRILTAALKESPTAIIATNLLLPEWRENSSPAAASGVERGPRTVGGLALRHFAALRIAIAPLQLWRDRDTGSETLRVTLTIAKNKCGVPGGTAIVDLLRGGGIDHTEEVVRLSLLNGLLINGSLGITFGGMTLGASPAAVSRRLTVDHALTAQLTSALHTTTPLRVA